MSVTVHGAGVVWSHFALYPLRSTATGLVHGTVEVGALMSRLSGIQLCFDLEQYEALLASLRNSPA